MKRGDEHPKRDEKRRNVISLSRRTTIVNNRNFRFSHVVLLWRCHTHVFLSVSHACSVLTPNAFASSHQQWFFFVCFFSVASSFHNLVFCSSVFDFRIATRKKKDEKFHFISKRQWNAWIVNDSLNLLCVLTSPSIISFAYSWRKVKHEIVAIAYSTTRFSFWSTKSENPKLDRPIDSVRNANKTRNEKLLSKAITIDVCFDCDQTIRWRNKSNRLDRRQSQTRLSHYQFGWLIFASEAGAGTNFPLDFFRAHHGNYTIAENRRISFTCDQ